MKWTNLQYKAEGVKIRDNEHLLREALKGKRRGEAVGKALRARGREDAAASGRAAPEPGGHEGRAAAAKGPQEGPGATT